MREIGVLALRHLRSALRTRAARVLVLVYLAAVLAAIWLPAGDSSAGSTLVLFALVVGNGGLSRVPLLKTLDPKSARPADGLREGYPWLAPHHRRHGARSGVMGSGLNQITALGVRWQSLIVSPHRLDWMRPPVVGTDPRFQWWARLRKVPASWISSRRSKVL